jgi:ATP-binding cassette subfamily A (ABC1) protein 3
MALLQHQIWTLIGKNIRIAFLRHAPSTVFRAFWLPVVYIVILGYIRNVFIPPSKFGIATSTRVRSLDDAMDAAAGSRTTLAFVNSGLSGGDIDKVIANVAAPLQSAGKDVQFLTHDTDLLTTCRSSLKGVSGCFAAAVFYSSPAEGTGGIWNYTIRIDGALGTKIDVGETNNDAEIYTIPLQHSIDFSIAALNTTISQAALPTQIDEFMFTTMTQKQRAISIRQSYMNGIAKYTAVTFFLAAVGIVRQIFSSTISFLRRLFY